MKPHEMAPNRSKTDRRHKNTNKGLKQRYLLKMNDGKILYFPMRGPFFIPYKSLYLCHNDDQGLISKGQ